MEVNSQLKVILRWVAVLPAAILANYAAGFLFEIGNNITMGMRMGSDSFSSSAFIVFAANAAGGAAFVYVGARVAPSQKKAVAYILAGVVLGVTVFMLSIMFMASNYWEVWALASRVIGVGATVYSVNTNVVRV